MKTKKRIRRKRLAVCVLICGLLALVSLILPIKEVISAPESIPDILWIRAHEELYPEYMLDALDRNVELAGFLRGYPEAEPAVSGGISEEEATQSYPLFLQWDKRWGYAPYGNDNIAMSGCGPTSLSMVIFSLTRDEGATPDALARYSMENGYYVDNVGTAWTFMTDAAMRYGLAVEQIPADQAAMKQRLDDGQILICSMGPGDFTTSGHFIVIYANQENGFCVNDPFSRRNSSRLWEYDTLSRQIVNIWAYSL